MGVVVKDNLPNLKKALKALLKDQVMVGVPAENAERDGDEINNAVIGYTNETGVPERNLPARPHLVPGVQSVLPQIEERMKKAFIVATTGDVTAVEKAQHAIGLVAQNAVRTQIDATLSPALSPVTLYRRKTRKIAPRTGTKPLLDTGGYRNSITYVIRKV